MSQIEITCIDQTAIYTDTPEIFSGDVNVDTVKFIFDDSWNDYTNKTAVFYNDPKNVYPQILDVNDVAVIPSQVIANKCKLSIGVVGTNANGDIKTSKILTYNVGKGAISDDLESSTATPDIWLQILIQLEYLRTFVDEKQDSMDARITSLENQQIYTYILNNTMGSKFEDNVSTLPFDFDFDNHPCAVVLNDEIHILSGDGNTYHYKWDGTSWSSVSTLPYNFYHGSAVVLNNEIHILGGNNTDDDPYTKHYKWDGIDWIFVSTLPYRFIEGMEVVLNNEIHIFGSTIDNCEKNHYKWDGTSWSSVSTLPIEINNFNGFVVLNNEIHALGFGGIIDNTSCTNHYKWNGTSWVLISTVPYLFSRAIVVLNNEIYALNMNDYDSASPTTTMPYYKWDGINWSVVSTIPSDVIAIGGFVVLNNDIHMLGIRSSPITGSYRAHHKLGYYNFLSGYVKSNTNIYLPIPTKAYTDNLEVINDGYRVTQDGYIKILIE